MSDWVSVGKTNKFASEGAFSIKVKEAAICLVHHNGQYFAMDDQCTHAESLLSSGEVEDGEISCPLHGARFELKSGQAVTPPATRPVRMHEVKLEGDSVLVRIKESPTDH